MHKFERDAIDVIVGNGVIAPQVRSQLALAVVTRRAHDAHARVAYFDVDLTAPAIVPHEAELSADLDVDAYGTVEASLTISQGRLVSLDFAAPAPHWPEHPRILGLAPLPDG